MSILILIDQYKLDCKSSKTPWTLWQFRDNRGYWVTCSEFVNPTFKKKGIEYRRK